MFKRKNLNYKKSKRNFSKTASTSHRKNFQAKPMRGGIRL